MLKKAGVIIVIMMVFILSYKFTYDNILYTKAFPSLPKPLSSEPIKDARGLQTIVYNIITNDSSDDVKNAYNEVLKKNGYVTTFDNKIIHAIKNNNKYDITFKNINNGFMITIERIE